MNTLTPYPTKTVQLIFTQFFFIRLQQVNSSNISETATDEFICQVMALVFMFLFFTNYTQMQSSEDDKEYESSIRSLDTSNESADLSDKKKNVRK